MHRTSSGAARGRPTQRIGGASLHDVVQQLVQLDAMPLVDPAFLSDWEQFSARWRLIRSTGDNVRLLESFDVPPRLLQRLVDALGAADSSPPLGPSAGGHQDDGTKVRESHSSLQSFSLSASMSKRDMAAELVSSVSMASAGCANDPLVALVIEAATTVPLKRPADQRQLNSIIERVLFVLRQGSLAVKHVVHRCHRYLQSVKKCQQFIRRGLKALLLKKYAILFQCKVAECRARQRLRLHIDHVRKTRSRPTVASSRFLDELRQLYVTCWWSWDTLWRCVERLWEERKRRFVEAIRASRLSAILEKRHISWVDALATAHQRAASSVVRDIEEDARPSLEEEARNGREVVDVAAARNVSLQAALSDDDLKGGFSRRIAEARVSSLFPVLDFSTANVSVGDVLSQMRRSVRPVKPALKHLRLDTILTALGRVPDDVHDAIALFENIRALVSKGVCGAFPVDVRAAQRHQHESRGHGGHAAGFRMPLQPPSTAFPDQLHSSVSLYHALLLFDDEEPLVCVFARSFAAIYQSHAAAVAPVLTGSSTARRKSTVAAPSASGYEGVTDGTSGGGGDDAERRLHECMITLSQQLSVTKASEGQVVTARRLAARWAAGSARAPSVPGSPRRMVASLGETDSSGRLQPDVAAPALPRWLLAVSSTKPWSTASDATSLTLPHPAAARVSSVCEANSRGPSPTLALTSLSGDDARKAGSPGASAREETSLVSAPVQVRSARVSPQPPTTPLSDAPGAASLMIDDMAAFRHADGGVDRRPPVPQRAIAEGGVASLPAWAKDLLRQLSARPAACPADPSVRCEHGEHLPRDVAAPTRCSASANSSSRGIPVTFRRFLVCRFGNRHEAVRAACAAAADAQCSPPPTATSCPLHAPSIPSLRAAVLRAVYERINENAAAGAPLVTAATAGYDTSPRRGLLPPPSQRYPADASSGCHQPPLSATPGRYPLSSVEKLCRELRLADPQQQLRASTAQAHLDGTVLTNVQNCLTVDRLAAQPLTQLRFAPRRPASRK